MDDRVISFDGIRNFRDFGAYPAADGRMIQSGRMYRSAQFGEATPDDLARLNTMNIVVQADLRRPDERERHGHRWPEAGAVNVLSSDKGESKNAPHIRFLSEVAVDADQAQQWMVEYYQQAPYREQHIDLFSEWFQALLTLGETEAAVVNCAAGKDRTGILCALTHHALGVSEDLIFDDYEMTNVAANVDERMPAVARMFNKQLGKDYPAEVYKPFVGVERKFLRAAMDSLTERSGSLDEYLSATLGIGEPQKDILRSKLLT